MKFAALALIGSASAFRREWSGSDVSRSRKMWEAIGRTLDEAEMYFPEHREQMNKRMEKAEAWMEEIGPKYVEEYEAWMQTDAVEAAKKYKHEVNLPSKELRRVVYDTGSLVSDFANDNFDMDWGFTAEGGYYEEMHNDDIRHVFEEVYQIKEDIKNYLTSDMMAEQWELDQAAFADEHFQKMVSFWQEDKICDRLKACMKKLRHHMRESPVARRLKKQIVRLWKFAKSTEKVSDEGNKEEWENWWNSNDFQPWN